MSDFHRVQQEILEIWPAEILHWGHYTNAQLGWGAAIDWTEGRHQIGFLQRGFMLYKSLLILLVLHCHLLGVKTSSTEV